MRPRRVLVTPVVTGIGAAFVSTLEGVGLIQWTDAALSRGAPPRTASVVGWRGSLQQEPSVLIGASSGHPADSRVTPRRW